MNRYRGPAGGPSKASASTTCQKCLKKDRRPCACGRAPLTRLRHYSYECTASAQDRPYASRPSRTAQLFNPKLVPELTSDVPNELLRKCVVRLLLSAGSLTCAGKASRTSSWPGRLSSGNGPGRQAAVCPRAAVAARPRPRLSPRPAPCRPSPPPSRARRRPAAGTAGTASAAQLPPAPPQRLTTPAARRSAGDAPSRRPCPTARPRRATDGARRRQSATRVAGGAPSAPASAGGGAARRARARGASGAAHAVPAVAAGVPSNAAAGRHRPTRAPTADEGAVEGQAQPRRGAHATLTTASATAAASGETAPARSRRAAVHRRRPVLRSGRASAASARSASGWPSRRP